MIALTPPPDAASAVSPKPLRFHWSLSQAGTPFRRATSAKAQSGQLPFEAQLELCQCADENGIDSLLMAIGFARPDPILLSICLGQKTERVKFMIACRPGLISPAAFVQQINTLSLLVDGRVHINIVGGHTPRELQYYGDWLPREERYDRLDEFLTVCRAFWDSNSAEVNSTGRYYQVKGGRLPTPFSLNGERRPEIYLGGNSEQSAALAIRHADCLWRFAEPPETLAPAIAPVVRTGTEVGLLVSLVARPTRSEAIRAAHDLVDRFDETACHTQRKFERQTDAAAFQTTYALARECSTEWATSTLWTGAVKVLGAPAIALVGSAEEIAASLLAYKAIGVTQFLFTGWPDLEEMVFFGQEILPRVRASERCEPAAASSPSA
ncbi:MAG TPA: LLM class flavin-dependent oxidoreductase [Chthoniobacterales bacterium]|nr:LLM class flavin-dependent oxidoreductase [Chthoniobacterales bacterium]